MTAGNKFTSTDADLGERRLVCDMIELAINQAKKPVVRRVAEGSGRRELLADYRRRWWTRVDAVAWLASKAASPWLLAVGVDQRAMLLALNWVDMVLDVILEAQDFTDWDRPADWPLYVDFFEEVIVALPSA
jgi:hypothetical protein